ncbi:MAG: methyltransferase [Pseudohongiellaceae bacterium]
MMNAALLQVLKQELDHALQNSSSQTLWIVDENVEVARLLALPDNTNLVALTNRCDTHLALQAAGIQAVLNDFDFTAWPAGTFNTVIYRVSKERALVHHCINEAHAVLALGGQLILLGGKQDGIKTNAKSAAQAFGCKEHIKKHGAVYRAAVTKTQSSLASALDSQQYSQLRLCYHNEMEFLSKPGIFGWNKVDKGSLLLVEQLRKLLSDRDTIQIPSGPAVLDLGCGYGYLLLATADLPFASRTATDNNAATICAAEANFARYELAVNVLLDDCGKNLQERFDLILCNPPFHLGFAANRELTENFLRQIQRLLSDQGVALLVVNQFIPLETLAAEFFDGVDLISSTASFKVVALRG